MSRAATWRTLLLLLLLGWPAWAQTDELVVPTDKLITTNADPLDPGDVELQLFYFGSRSHSEFNEEGRRVRGPSRHERQFSAGVEFGVAENFDITVATGSSSVLEVLGASQSTEIGPAVGARRAGSLNDLNVLLRWQLINDEESGFRLSIYGNPALSNELHPTVGGERLVPGGSFLSYEQGLVLQQQTGRFCVALEAYYGFPLSSAEDTFHDCGANLAAGYALNDWLTPLGEVNYYRLLPNEGPASETWGLTLGAIVQVADEVRLYGGYQWDLAGRNTARFGTVILGLVSDF